jgi:hypothetical protein
LKLRKPLAAFLIDWLSLLEASTIRRELGTYEKVITEATSDG